MVQKNVWIAGQDEGHSLDVHNFYHWRREVWRNVGTDYVFSMNLITKASGVYSTGLAFLTDEIEGSADFTIVVEDRPHSKMKCHEHRNCYVRPLKGAT